VAGGWRRGASAVATPGAAPVMIPCRRATLPLEELPEPHG